MEVKISLNEVISRARVHLMECLQGTEYALYNERDIDPDWRETLQKEADILTRQVYHLDQFFRLEIMMENEVNNKRHNIQNDPAQGPLELAGLES